MINILDVRNLIVKPVLKATGTYSLSAENLLIGTGLVESHFNELHQKGGPALSFWQIEPATHAWLIARLSMNRELRQKVLELFSYTDLPLDPNQLMYNMGLACLIARLKYWFDPTPLPHSDDIESMALYHGKIYNTLNKPETRARFVQLYELHGKHK